MSPQKIVILSGSADLDSHREFFTVGTRICDQPYAIFRQPALPTAEQEFTSIGEKGQQIVDELMQIDGVEGLLLRSESIKVTKSFTRSWKDLQPQVEKVLKLHLGQLEISTDYESMTNVALEMVS